MCQVLWERECMENVGSSCRLLGTLPKWLLAMAHGQHVDSGIIMYIWPLFLMGCMYHYCSMWCVHVYLIICVVNDEYPDSSTVQGFCDC